MPLQIDRLSAAQVAARLAQQWTHQQAHQQTHQAAQLAAQTKGPTPMRLRMLLDHTGSPNGTHVYTYLAGQVYDAHSAPPMSERLASIFLQEGWAEDADAVAPEPEPEPVAAEPEPPVRRFQRRSGPTERKAAALTKSGEGADNDAATA